MIKKFEKLYCLKSSLGNKGWIEDKDIIKPYLLEDRGLYKGYSSLLLRPKSAKEVGQILSIFSIFFLKWGVSQKRDKLGNLTCSIFF